MRPRKVVLCVDSEDELCLQRFRLHLWGYRPLSVTSADEAIWVLGTRRVDAVIVVADHSLVRNLREIDPQLRTMLITRTQRSEEISHNADICLGIGNNNPIHVRGWLKLLCARKRGPNKTGVRPISLRDREDRAA